MKQFLLILSIVWLLLMFMVDSGYRVQPIDHNADKPIYQQAWIAPSE